MIYYTISKEDEKEIRMLVFDKSVTLFDKLKEYDKESLKLYGSDLGLTKLSKFRKDELVQKVVDKLLDLDVMFYRGAILSDKQIAVLERGFLSLIHIL